ncbi:MAG: hypothetical protein Kow0059_21180 [Candidatus Sumerlaeia bacterium]
MLPVVYLVACLAIKRWWFEPRELYFGLLGVSHGTYLTLMVVGGAAALLIELGIVSLKQISARHLGEALEAGRSPEIVAAHLRTRTFLLLALCDLTGFLGLLIFLVSAQVFAPFLFGLISLMFYLQSRPI